MKTATTVQKRQVRASAVPLPSEPLQLPAAVHYTKTENGKRVTMRGMFYHSDDPFGGREFLWKGQYLNVMTVFEFEGVVYVKPTTVQHQFRRDKNGFPLSGKGWNAIFVSNSPVIGSKPEQRRCYTLQHYRMSVGFRNDPLMTIEKRDDWCLRARHHYKSSAFITLLGTAANSSPHPHPQTRPSSSPPVSPAPRPSRKRRAVPHVTNGQWNDTVAVEDYSDLHHFHGEYLETIPFGQSVKDHLHDRPILLISQENRLTVA